MGTITLEGAAGIAMGQWACRRLRDAVRTATGARDADAHLDSVRKALESEAPAVLRRMPVADGVNSRRRSKATAAAKGQLSLFDALAQAQTGAAPAPTLFDIEPNLEQTANMVSSVSKEAQDGEIRDEPSVQRREADKVQAASGDEPRVGRAGLGRGSWRTTLYALEKRYQDRCHQLVEENWEKVLAADPTVQGTATAITVGETISARAREIAMSELLEA